MLVRILVVALLARLAWVLGKDFLPGAWKKAKGSRREQAVVVAMATFLAGFLLWGLVAAIVGDVSLGFYTERRF